MRSRFITLAICGVWVTAAIGLFHSFRVVGPLDATGTSDLPQNLSRLVSALVSLDSGEVKSLKAGKPVSKLIDTDADREVAVFGAEWIEAEASDYLRAMEDIEHFELGNGFQMTKRISDPPEVDDFAGLELQDDDIDDLKDCRVSDCMLKLGKSAIERIRNYIHWSKPGAKAHAAALFRQILFEYVTAYQKEGNAGLVVYGDKNKPKVSAREFVKMVDQMSVLRRNEPDLRKYLLEYPRTQLPNATSFFYWQIVKFGLKPTIRVNHLVMLEAPDHVVVASKQLYASHYFWTALELRVLIPDRQRGAGFWFVNVSCARPDGLNGLQGSVIRGRVRDEALEGLTVGLKSTKALLERGAR